MLTKAGSRVLFLLSEGEETEAKAETKGCCFTVFLENCLKSGLGRVGGRKE